MNLTYRFIRGIKFHKYDSFLLPDDITRQDSIRRQWTAWKAAFDRFMPTAVLTENQHDAAQVLELHYLNGAIWLEIGVQPRETCSDEFMPQFGSTVRVAENILSFAGAWQPRSALKPNFLFDMEIISPLYLCAVKCRHPQIRRRAVSILKRTMRREGLWDSHMAAAIAERVMEIEEADLRVLDGSELPAEEKRVHTLHVQSISCVRHRITFYAKPHGIDGLWRIWHEEIHLSRETVGRSRFVRAWSDTRCADEHLAERNHPHPNRYVPPHNYYETHESLDKLLDQARVQQYGFDGHAMFSGKQD